MGDDGVTEADGPSRAPSSLAVQATAFFVLGLAVGVSFGWGWSALPRAMLGSSPDLRIAPFYLTLSLAVLLMLAWAPFVDAVPAPFRRGLGQRRGWALALVGVAIVVSALWWAAGPGLTVLGFVLGLATLAVAPGLLVAVDALRVDGAASPRHQGILAAAQVVGAAAGNYALLSLAAGDPAAPRSPVLLVLGAVWFVAAAAVLIVALRAPAIPDHAAESGRGGAGSGLARLAWRLAGAALADLYRRLGGRLVAAVAGFVFAGVAASGTGLLESAMFAGGSTAPSPAILQLSTAVGGYLDLLWAVGGIIGALAAWRWSPATAFAAALGAAAALYAAALILAALGVGGFGLVIAARALGELLLGLLFVPGMAFAATLCRAPYTAVQFTILMVVWTAATLASGFWGIVGMNVLHVGRLTMIWASLAIVLGLAVLAAVCVRRARGAAAGSR